MICPKCGHQQNNTEHCEACGIYFEKYRKLQERLSREETSVETVISESNSTAPIKFIVVICILALGSYFIFRPDPATDMVADSATAVPETGKPEAKEPSGNPPEGIASKINDKFTPRNDIERSRNATVFIETAWGSSGSGFIVSKDCWGVTNRHVVKIDRDDTSSLVLTDPEVRMRLQLEIVEKQQQLSYLKMKYNALKSNGYMEEAQRMKQKIATLEEEIADLPNKYTDAINDKLDEMEQRGRSDGYQVSLIDGTSFKIFDMIVSEDHDLAMFRLPGENCPYLKLNPDDDLQQGTSLYTIGSPSGLGYTVTSGIFSGYRMLQEERYLQTDAPINPGNSGGPLITSDGSVVGINTLILSGTEGIGFAIPAKVLSEEFQQTVKFTSAAAVQN